MSSTLGTLSYGSAAPIAAVRGDRSFRRRLFELGFLPGTPVRLLAAAPLGDPLDVEVRGCRFSLRRAEAALIEVDPTPALLAAK